MPPFENPVGLTTHPRLRPRVHREKARAGKYSKNSGLRFGPPPPCERWKCSARCLH